MTQKWDPMRDLVSLQDRMNRLFEDVSQRRSRDGEKVEGEIEQVDWYPAADVYEKEREFTIVLDLPGIQRSALDVNLDNDRLTIRGARAAAAEDSPAQQRRAERPAGRFARSFSLPANVERETISADYKDGVLRLRLPKRSEQKGRRVEIEVR